MPLGEKPFLVGKIGALGVSGFDPDPVGALALTIFYPCPRSVEGECAPLTLSPPASPNEYEFTSPVRKTANGAPDL